MDQFEGINAEILEQLRQEEPDLFAEEPSSQEKLADQEPEPDVAEGRSEEPVETTGVPEEEPTKPADGTAKKPEDKTVPLAALHEERERRKRTQQELDLLRTQMNQLAQLQIEQARRAMAQQKPVPEAEPKDPLEELIDLKIQEKLKPIEREAVAIKQAQAMEMRITAQEQAARAAHPDFDEVVEPVEKLLKYWGERAANGDMESQAKLYNFRMQPNPIETAYMLGCAYRYQEAKKAQSQQGQIPQQHQAHAKPAPRMPRTEGMGGGGGVGGVSIDLENITTDEWAKLPHEVRNKLLMGIKT